MDKTYITANELLSDAFRLGIAIKQSEFEPDLIIGIWRGGTPIAIAIHEYFNYTGSCPDHFAIKTSFYDGIDERKADVQVTGLEYLEERKNEYGNILIVDDVFDTGKSINTAINLVREIDPGYNIKTATPWYKPENNQTDTTPDFYLHETARWLVFPHELDGLTIDEIKKYKPKIHQILSEVK